MFIEDFKHYEGNDIINRGKLLLNNDKFFNKKRPEIIKYDDVYNDIYLAEGYGDGDIFTVDFALTDEQIEKIKEKTDNMNLASNFTLPSIESRSFSTIKSEIISIAQANSNYRSINGQYADSLLQLIYGNDYGLRVYKNQDYKTVSEVRIPF